MSIRLKDHISKSLKSLKFALLLFACVTSFLVTFLVTLQYSVDADRAAILASRNYLVSLVTSNDRPDVLRMIDSIGSERNRELTIISDGIVFATNWDLALIDSPMPQTQGVTVFGHTLTGAKLEHQLVLSTDPKVLITVRGSVWSLIITAFFSALIFTSLVLLAMILVNCAIRRSVDRGLSQLSEVVDAVKLLGQGLEVPKAKGSIPITELQDIQASIEAASHALQTAQSALAASKARELTARAFQNLIHDLHTPVASLSAWALILKDETLEEAERADAIAGVIRLAGQILRQVTAGRKNLEEGYIDLSCSDLSLTVRNCIDQICKARNQSRVTIKATFPDDPVLTAHDSSAISRAVVNLLENAVDAASSTVRVDILQVEEIVTVRVQDDGPGIAPEEVSQFMSGRGLSRKKDRQAFGLSSAAHVAHAHNGRIIHRRSDLGGACFEIQLGVQ